ncbi:MULTISPECIES: helix-turn-helix domain-containing protein [Thermus]|uniref:helix-turn-helix domain-containing protein n=1 Tax=Thermus TaxID=270 RepID=UPI001F225B98|nr:MULTISPECIES: helix-turn-helix transcriptional regulator [Thermus]
MPRVRFKLKEVLEQEGLSAYRLERLLGDRISRATVYRWVRSAPARPDLEALAWVIWGLRKLTGKPYDVCDLLEYEEE